MDENKLAAENAAGEISAPILEEKIPFSPSFREKIAAFLIYIAAYLYIDGLEGLKLACFVVLFVALTELLNWDKPCRRENWVWLGCIAVILAGILLGRDRVWADYSILFLHIFAVWWALSRSGRLLEGESGHLLPFDALNGFIVFPFRYFFLRIRTVWYTLTHLFRRNGKAKPETAAWTVVALFAAFGLFWLAARLLMDADKGFANLLSGMVLNIKFDTYVCFQILLSLPVGAYLFGLIVGSAREDEKKLRKQGEHLCSVLNSLAKVPNFVWTVLTGLFCLLYLLFFLVQTKYLFGAFTRTLPEGFIVSEYARQGFFELCKVMTINFVLLWLITRLSSGSVRKNRPEKAVCIILLAESMLFAVVAFSKLMLYISCFGFTPLRLQSSWLVCVLFFGCVCAVYSLLSGKKSFRIWMMFGAVTLALLHLY